jgi:hypothetical protein
MDWIGDRRWRAGQPGQAEAGAEQIVVIAMRGDVGDRVQTSWAASARLASVVETSTPVRSICSTPSESTDGFDRNADFAVNWEVTASVSPVLGPRNSIEINRVARLAGVCPITTCRTSGTTTVPVLSRK